MGSITQIHGKAPEQLADEYLAGLAAKFAACKGFGHRFPRPGDKRNGLKRAPLLGGGTEYSAKCPDCGTIRYRTRAQNSRYSEGSGYRYDYPDGYLAPAGTGDILTRGRYQDDSFDRWEEELEHPTGGEDMPRFSHAS